MENECEIAVSGFRQQRTWDAVSVTYTDYLLNRVVQALRPSTQEWQTRTAVIERLQSVLAGMPDFQPVPGRYGSNYSEDCLARVDVFGSFCSSLYHKGSDLDLTITGRWRDRHGHVLDMATMSSADTADMLHRIRRALISRRVAAADPLNPATVINARVPLVMYTDADSGVAVDISVCNHGGVFKSRFTREVMQFDDRFEALYRMVSVGGFTHVSWCISRSVTVILRQQIDWPWFIQCSSADSQLAGQGWHTFITSTRSQSCLPQIAGLQCLPVSVSVSVSIKPTCCLCLLPD
eukprot:GHUV01027135.1.p1 GENE.GHUV01027135.1~~GHUV01027135.1.p1  ORF type:complete len:293 (+),score=34.25 GHUV01027135.1:344-1222(+)